MGGAGGGGFWRFNFNKGKLIFGVYYKVVPHAEKKLCIIGLKTWRQE